MRILADSAIAEVVPAFSSLGDLHCLPAHAITASALAGFDALLIRTVSKVHASLLEGTKIRWVGTATAGTDHIDLQYLQQQNIAFAHAPGCNADAVADYVYASLAYLAESHSLNLSKQTLAIVGCGQVGSRVRLRAQKLGLNCILCDPPLAEENQDSAQQFKSLTEVLNQADIISFHVPLTHDGAHPTHHMMNDKTLAQLKPNALLINTSRGQIIDEYALLSYLNSGKKLNLVLDVWETEPMINLELLNAASIGTPHIAGYSLEGKLRATAMLRQAYCQHFALDSQWDWPAQLGEPPHLKNRDTLFASLLTAYNPRTDDTQLRALQNMQGNELASAFEKLRSNYPLRREFSSYASLTLGTRNLHWLSALNALGFPCRT